MTISVLGTAELAQRINEPVYLVAKWRQRGKVPAPDFDLAMGPVWLSSSIDAWEAAGRPKNGGAG
jgi:hypothetical protein